MIIGLDVDTPVVEKGVSFVTRQLTQKRTQVVYNETLQKLKSLDIVVDKLVIPSSLPGCDYSFEKLIEHIRIDSDALISHTPILVYLKDEDFDLLSGSKTFQESWFKNIAVSFSLNPACEDFILECDKEAWQAYQYQAGKIPYKMGSHDKTNTWGSYIVLSSLNSVDKGNTRFISGTAEMHKHLIEETYYKRLLQSFTSCPMSDAYKNLFKSEIASFKDTLKLGKVLIVEDQLKDGWQDAYEAIFSGSKGIKLLFAEDEQSANKLARETHGIDLILLDIRLASDRKDSMQDETSQPVEKLSGVKLANEIRGILPTVPIIAATASNKSWTLEALLERGINSYWVKASPDLIDTVDLGIENIIDLYKKINVTLQWSKRTRFWQEELYRIANNVNKIGGSSPLGNRLQNKAKSLHALLFRSFTPFSKDLSEGMQMNIAFLTIYSCMNDLIAWVCNIESTDDTIKWYLQGDFKKTPVVEKRKSHNEKYEWFVQDRSDHIGSWDFPDTAVAKCILISKKLDFEGYANMSKIRNGLPLIHGKMHESGSSVKSVESVTDEQITTMVRLLTSLVDHHMAYLEKQGNLS